MLKKVGVGNLGEYFERLAIFLIFAFCAIISIIVWVFNWICWKRQCCCFDFYDDYCNKVFSWWLSWIFLCGVLACCIAGFVTANRFGFASYGIQCAYERIYYDSIYGQLKKTYPKWEGFDNLENVKNLLTNFITILEKNDYNLPLENFYLSKDDLVYSREDKDEIIKCLFFPIPKYLVDPILKNVDDKENNIKNPVWKNDLIEIIDTVYNKINKYVYINKMCIKIKNSKQFYIKQINKIDNLIQTKSLFSNYKSQFMDNFTYYVKLARALGKILPIIYFAILLTFVVGSGALLITYYCKKINQQWWILPMHIAWNGLRFFIFSFFMYGCVYGMLYLFTKDFIACLQYAFSIENIESNNPIIIPSDSKNFFKYCILGDTSIFDYKGDGLLDEFISNIIKYNSIIVEYPETKLININNNFEDFIKNLNQDFGSFYLKIKDQLDSFIPKINETGTIYANFNCSFVNSTINLMYRAMWDLYWETRILCALSCCIGFFGAIAVYSFLWVMKLWSREDNNINNAYNNKGNKKKKKKKMKIKPPNDIDDESNTELVNTNKNNYYNDEE